MKHNIQWCSFLKNINYNNIMVSYNVKHNNQQIKYVSVSHLFIVRSNIIMFRRIIYRTNDLV